MRRRCDYATIGPERPLRIDALIFDPTTLWDVEPVILRAEERLAEFSRNPIRARPRATRLLRCALRTRLVIEHRPCSTISPGCGSSRCAGGEQAGYPRHGAAG
jgi:hypothetical protein